VVNSGDYKQLGTEPGIEDRRGNPKPMIPLARSVRVTLELVIKAKTWLATVRPDTSIVSLATKPEATITLCEVVQNTTEDCTYT
jgi:hypothetical protein